MNLSLVLLGLIGAWGIYHAFYLINSEPGFSSFDHLLLAFTLFIIWIIFEFGYHMYKKDKAANLNTP